MRKSWLMTVLLLLLFSTALYSREAEAQVTIPRKMKIFLKLSENVAFDESLLLSESLLFKLSEPVDIMVLEPLVNTNIPAGDDNINSFVAAEGGDCWLLVEIEATEENFDMVLTSYDIFEKKYVYKQEKISRKRSLRSITRSFWRDIITNLDNHYNSTVEVQKVKEVTTIVTKEEIVVEKKGVSITLEGAPGTVISGLNDELVVIGSGGTVTVEVAGYTTYTIKANRRGYYPYKKEFYIEYEKKNILLKQIKASIFGFDAYFQHIDYAGIGAFYYILPNNLWVELQATFFQKKIIWPVNEPERYDLNLTHVFLNFGYYFLPEDFLFRVAVTTGAFVRVVALDNLVTLDPLSPWGLKMAGAYVEIRALEKIRPFAEYAALLYFTPDSSQMQAALTMIDSSSEIQAGYLFLNKATIDLLNFKIGVRINLP